ncbi:MAG TPA: MFS transporter [Bryobacteraceae bacterium]|nr:MFS transporter [Bryobacteraceae bacterium]
MAAEIRKFTLVQWLICLVASIGFAFDIYEILVLPLIVGPALAELGGLKPGTPAYLDWVGWLFFIPAFAGGIFGMIGGYLTDLWGRRRVLVWSILIYAFSALAAGFATSLEQLLFFRCTTFIGVCVEFVAAVAWLAELFPEEKLREKVLGYTQAFSSIGGLLVTTAYYIAVTNASSFPAIHGGHAAWRYTLISGLLPAIPLMIIRPFLPESPAWAAKKAAGTLKRPSFGALFQPQFARTTWVTMIMYAASYAAAFGAIQQIPRIVPGLAELATLPPPAIQKVVSGVQFWQEMGGLLGRVALAVLAVAIVSRRQLIRIFQIPGLFIVPWVFFVASGTNVSTLQWGIAIVGFLTVAQFSFWGNYLPRVYPTHLRGTGESFAANIGGRMLGTSAALLTTQLAKTAPGAGPAAKLAYAAAIVGTAAYVIGFAASFFLPEPPKELPE